MSSLERYRRGTGFSLIEVLVVVSIIALLIAILLPALNRSRETTRDLQCMNNMAGLMKATTNYSIDYDGYLPNNREWIWGYGDLRNHPSGRTLPGGGTNFTQYAQDYTTTEAAEYGTLNPYVSDFNAHFCPTAPEQPLEGLKHGLTHQGDKVLRSYVMNSRVSDDFTLEGLRAPASVLILGEENTFSMLFASMPGVRRHFSDHPMNDGRLDLVWDNLGSIHRRTQGENLRSGYSVGVFADGHTEWVFPHSYERNPADRRHYWATEAFARDDLPNPEEMDTTLIDQSLDYDFSY